MKRHLAAIALLSIGVAASASSTTPPIAVELPDGQVAQLTKDSLATLPRVSVTAESHGESHDYAGVSLVAALKLAGLASTESLRGKDIGLVLIAEATDGYRAASTLAELDATIGAREVLKVDTTDGEPLPAAQGPWRLVVAADKRPALWVWSLVRLRIVQVL